MMKTIEMTIDQELLAAVDQVERALRLALGMDYVQYARSGA